MAAKRQLYHPVTQKSKIGHTKTRKPLVQGRLKPDGEHFQHQINEHNVDHSGTSSQLSSLLYKDDSSDPSLSPRRFVPKVTERSSPRHPEPPLPSLDLSDSDMDGDINASASTQGSKQVMVCDASHLGNSSNGTEVDVVVGHEDSPARIVCHTPRQLERSFRSESGDIPHWSISAERVPKVSLTTSSVVSPSNLLVTQSFKSTEENEAINQSVKSTERASKSRVQISEDDSSGVRLSERSRGIIQEILAQELNDSSPHSERSSASPKHHSSKYSVSNMTSDSESKVLSKEKSHNTKQHREPLSTSSPLENLSHPTVNSESSSNYADTSPSNPIVSDSSPVFPPKVPIIRKPKSKASKKHISSADNDSDACSLYEYVTPRKPPHNLTKNKLMAGKTSFSKPPVPSSSKKKKTGKVVQSRFMLTASNHQSKSGSSSQSSLSAVSKTDKSFKSSSQTSLGKGRNVTKELVPKKSRPKTSTPTLETQPSFSHSIDASAINSVSTLSFNVGSNDPIQAKSTEPVSQIRLDLEHNRFIQSQFILFQAKKAFRAQEAQAKSELHALWNLVEARRQECFKLEKEVARLQCLNLVDSTLDLVDMDCLSNSLPQAKADWYRLSDAVNAIGHELATQDIAHKSTESEEEDLLNALLEMEALLTDLKPEGGSSDFNEFLLALETMDKGLHGSLGLLQKCKKHIVNLDDLTTRQVSLALQEGGQ